MGRKAYETFTCSCGEPCIMVPHATSGKLAPITTAYYEGGNVEIVADVKDGEPIEVYRIVSKAQREHNPMSRLLNHWSNCPDAASFRR